MLNCLMYKLIYYRFGEMKTREKEEPGYDIVRKQVIGNKDFKLNHFEEAYTTERWIVRIYKVLQPDVMGNKMIARHDNSAKTVAEIPKISAKPWF